MNRLNELIKELCSKGVEYKKFNDVAVYIRGVSYSKTKEVNDGRDGYKLLRANNITLTSNVLNFYEIKVIDFSVNVKENQMLTKDDILICAGSGSKEHIGKVAYIDNNIDYTFGGFMGVIRTKKDIILPRYMFHIMTSPIFKDHLYKVSNSSTINNINNDTWKDFRFPVPSLEVQCEIVHILDNFTELSAELSAELKARQQQYEHYRDKLINEGYEKEVQLNELCEIKGRIGFRGYTRNDLVEKGNGAISFSPGNINNETINYEKCTYVSWEKYEESPEIMINNNDILLCKTGSTLGKVAQVKDLPEKATINPQLVVLKNIKCNVSYLKFILGGYYFQSEMQSKKGLGSVPNITQKDIGEIRIKLHTKEKQKKIAECLEKLDSLCNDISEGLPAEIEARKKQYEYYRDKLLSFKELKVEE